MKVLIELIKIIAVTIIVGYLILNLTQNDYVYCEAIDEFSNSSIGIFDYLGVILLAFIIWIAGFVIYFLIKKKKKLNIYLYFSILTLIAFHSFIYNEFTRAPEQDREIKIRICEKSTDDGMQLNIKKLNKNEYDYINKTNWLPSLPNETKSVNVKYYRDHFLGDFHLIIDLEIPLGQKLDTTVYSKWTFNGKTYRFEEYQD